MNYNIDNGQLLNNSPENKGTELIEKQQIGCSPLYKIGNPERGYFVVLGQFRITEMFKDKNELDNYLQTEPEDFIVRLVQTLLEMNNKFSKQ